MKMNKIKLLYITNGVNGAGGLERVLSIKASYLAEHFDYEITILSLNEAEIQPFYVFSDKINFISVQVKGNPFAYILSYIKGLRKIVKDIKPDVISVCDDGLKGFFVPLFTGKPCPMIYERHVSKIATNKNNNLINIVRTSIIYRLMDIGGKLYDKFIVLTEQNKLEWKRMKHLKVISNPLSFYPQKKALLLNKKVISVGKLSYQKGQDMLIKAWEIVAQKHPDWKLEIYGKKDKNNYYQQLIEQKGLEKSICLFDPIANIEVKYLDASIYVLSSRFEGFGMVLIEAMVSGLSCVSFDCPYGPSDIITEGEDGFLVPKGDIEILANKIMYLIENNQERIRMGANARENVKRYLPENIIPQWDKLFKQLHER
jgi:glycosyltransferase involved in cell wall biosynthesis